MDYVPFPRFSSEKLAIWFAQVESVFTLNGILSDSDKYDYVVAQIPLDYSSIVEDILLNPPPDSKYDHIKYEFIKRMSIFRLKKEELGNDMPSEYLQRLIKMADTRVPIEIILNTWLKHLPKPVREIVSLETSGHIEVIGPMADKIMSLLLPSPLQCNTPLPSEQYEVVLKRMDELAKQVRVVQLMLDGDGLQEQQSSGKQERAVAVPGRSNEDNGNMNKPGPHRVVCCYHNILPDVRAICAGQSLSTTQYFK